MKEIKKLELAIKPVLAKAWSVTIKGDSDMRYAVENLSSLNRYLDEVTSQREAITKPLTAALKSARALFKPIEERLGGAIGSVRAEMSRYQTLEVVRVENEASKIAKRVGEGRGKIGIETAVRKIGEIDGVASSVIGDNGMVKFRSVRKFEILEVDKVPREYMVVDEIAVRKAMLAGVEIAGVRYFEEQVVNNFR